MSAFEKSKAYVAQGTGTFFNDGREAELVEYVTTHSECRGSPDKILKAIDEFGRTRKYLMNVGEDKGRIVVDLIKEVKPKVMVELGGYCGYSTLLFGHAAKLAGGQIYYSLERDAQFADNIRRLVEYAGLDGYIEVLTGASDEGIKRLHAERKVGRIDMIFLDHYKPAYTTDLKLCESLGLIEVGTVLAADNVISPGNPPYLKYVRSSVEEKRRELKHGTKQDTENFPGRSATQYGAVETLAGSIQGDPNLVYQSRLVDSYEPTGKPDGIEITRCIGREEI